jgi:hypothetical protein
MSPAMVLLPFQRRHLRRTTLLTLLAWVLALVAGLVNACQLQTHTPGSYAAFAAPPADGAERALHAGHALHGADGQDDGAGRHDRHDADPAKAGCVKFCNDKSSTVAKHETDPADLPVMLVAAGSDRQPASSMAAAAAWRSVERTAAQGPPLFIRFLRLTI